ncbi:MAG: glycoside hydrolase family 3 C-terminal domain-containing protein [Bacteroidota bacterium]
MKKYRKNRLFLSAVVLMQFLPGLSQSGNYQYPFQNPAVPVEKRAEDLVSRLTLEEKVAQMMYTAPGIERFGIPAYNWWNEALHGVARSGEKVTVFPQAIAMAATFSTEDLEIMGDMTATEARAIFNEDLRRGKEATIYRGLTFWTPNINIFRDPRWGRGQETYGEDPYLTGQMGTAFVKGLQGTDPKYMKASACAKHYAVHSGPESTRHTYNATPDPYDLWDTYLPAFRELVVNAGVSGVMCAYNRYAGQPCCGSDPLMTEILRNQWNFTGYVTSDCWAIDDFVKTHKTHTDNVWAASDAVIHGTDLECGGSYLRLAKDFTPGLFKTLIEGVKNGQITEKQINQSVKRLFMIRIRLGLLDPPEMVAFNKIPYTIKECKAHQEHALKMARESIVLLKNKNNLLPLNPDKVMRVAIIGPNASDTVTPLGTYNGVPSKLVTPMTGILKKLGPEAMVWTDQGVEFTTPVKGGKSLKSIAARAQRSDIIIFVGGISPILEGEEGDAGVGNPEGFSGGDRTTIALPAIQTRLMKELKKTGKPVIFICLSGSAVSMEWEAENMDAILQGWYGGQASGDALADVLFGKYNPSGRLPVTFYRTDQDLPPFDNYSMVNRTYRYFTGTPRYPFGYGLSYTTFRYENPVINPDIETGMDLTVKVKVTNSGRKDGDEVVQLYVTHPGAPGRVPLRSLQGFRRIHLKAGESREVEFTLSPKNLALVDEKGNLIQSAGDVKIFIGGGQPGYAQTVEGTVKVSGERYFVY